MVVRGAWCIGGDRSERWNLLLYFKKQKTIEGFIITIKNCPLSLKEAGSFLLAIFLKTAEVIYLSYSISG